MLVLSGFDGGKFLKTQLPSIWICEGGLGVTKPSSTPPRSATQRSSARASLALSSDIAKTNSRVTIHLYLPLKVIPSLVPITRQFVAKRDRGSPRVDWIPAVPPS